MYTYFMIQDRLKEKINWTKIYIKFVLLPYIFSSTEKNTILEYLILNTMRN